MQNRIGGYRDLKPLRQLGETNSNLSPCAQKLVNELKGYISQCKTVTQADVDVALSNPSNVRAVKGLIEKSPVGMTLQDSFEGYLPIHMTDEYGSSYFENIKGGRIRVTPDVFDNGFKEVEFTSKDGRYVQRMHYDEGTGKFIDGTIDIFDEFGNREKHYGIATQTNGKMRVITVNPETGRYEEENE